MRPMARRIALLAFVLLLFPYVYNYGYSLAGRVHTDFPSFYVGARLAFEQGESPYDFDALSVAGQAWVGKKPYPYLYPPPSLLVFWPFSLLSYNVAQTLMLALNLLLLPSLMFLILRLMRWRLGSPWSLFAIAYVFAYYPIVSVLNHGQINMLVLFLLCLTWYTLKKGSAPVLIALPLSLAILSKTSPALFCVYLLLKKQYRVLRLVLVLLALYCAISYALLPHDLWTDWFARVLPSGRLTNTPLNLFSPAAAANQSINGFVSRLFLENDFHRPLFPNAALAKVSGYLLSAIVIVSAGVLFRRIRCMDVSEVLDTEVSLVLLTMFLVSPLSWSHHLVFVLPSSLVALRRVLANGSGLVAVVVSLAGLLVAWRVPFLDTSAAFKSGPLTLAVSAHFYSVVCLWIYHLCYLRRCSGYRLS